MRVEAVAMMVVVVLYSVPDKARLYRGGEEKRRKWRLRIKKVLLKLLSLGVPMYNELIVQLDGFRTRRTQSFPRKKGPR